MTSVSYSADANIMQARPDGGVGSDVAVLLPIMAPRLQADCQPDGKIELSLWGVGKLGTVLFEALPGPYVYGPNSVITGAGGVHVAQSAPAMVIISTKLRRFFAARRAAWWHTVSAGAPKPRAFRTKTRHIVELAWGTLIAETRGANLVLAVGASRAEAEAALALSVEAIIAEAAAYAARCDRLPDADPVLRSMVIQGTHAALSSIRKDEHGQFAGLAAGQAYSAPARTYFRDGYWTLQPLLTLAPDAVRDQIRLLAKGVQPDGEAPSAVILSGPAQSAAWEVFRRNADRYKEEHLRPGDWWSDHFDSPLFFVLTLGDYVAATGNRSETPRHWPLVTAIFERYQRLCAGGRLPLKPHNDRDWADNVYREGLVSYDLGLWLGALDAIVALGPELDPELVARAKAAAIAGRKAIDAELWSDEAQGYADFLTPAGFAEDHLMLDTLTLSRYDGVPEQKSRKTLAAMATELESRNNHAQPYGDWGVLCAFPPYKRPSDVRAKSAFAFRYHNGSDWPYLDAIYAEERLKRGLGGARYALVRWWEVSLANGWAGAVEYYSPPFGRGSLLQGWSGLPAHVAVRFRDQLQAELVLRR